MLFQVSGCDVGFVQLVWEWSSCKLSAGVLRAAPYAPQGQCCPFTEGMEKQIGSMEGEQSTSESLLGNESKKYLGNSELPYLSTEIGDDWKK